MLRSVITAAGLGLAATTAGAVTLDFNSQATCVSTDANVTFSFLNGGTCVIEPSPVDGSGALGLRTPSSPSTARADFAELASFVSVDIGDFGADADNIFLAIYDSADTLLGSVDFLRPVDSEEMNTLSLSGVGISYALFGTNAADLGYISADNFTYTFDGGSEPSPVPVPASLPLLAAGLGALAWLRRRSA